MPVSTAVDARNGLAIGLPGQFWLFYASLFKPGPLVTLLGTTLAEHRPQIGQNQNLDFSSLGSPCSTRLLNNASGPEIVDLGRSKRAPPTAKPTGKGGELRPPPFPMGFAVGEGRSGTAWGCARRTEISILVLVDSEPVFGQSWALHRYQRPRLAKLVHNSTKTNPGDRL